MHVDLRQLEIGDRVYFETADHRIVELTLLDPQLGYVIVDGAVAGVAEPTKGYVNWLSEPIVPLGQAFHLVFGNGVTSVGAPLRIEIVSAKYSYVLED